MELSRQEYPALLASLQPSQATSLLNDRIRLIHKVNADIADWLQERRRVEELYVQGLRKLARRPQQDGGAALGVFQLPWGRIINATESLAASHEILAQKIEEDVERPLREYGSKHRELQSMPTMQGDLASLAKALESAQRKVDKTREKGPKAAEKVAVAQAALDESNQQWESRAPFVFEHLQAIDESRLNHLRDILTQFETHEADQIERNRQTAEGCLNVLLNVETADEIKTFAAKISGGKQIILRRPGSSSVNPVPLPPPPRIASDDTASQKSERSAHGRTLTSAPERHTPLGGLKRLGTVMQRRKSIVQSPGAGYISADKKSRAPFQFRRGDSSRDLHQGTFSPPDRDSPISHTLSRNSTMTPDSARGGSDFQERDEHSTMSAIQEVPVTTNGTSSADNDQSEQGQVEISSSQSKPDAEEQPERLQTIDEIMRAEREAAGLEEPSLNLTIRDQPIQEDEGEARQAMDEMANTLRLQAQQSGIRRTIGTLRGRRDVRNTVFVPNSPSATQEQSAISPGSDASAHAIPLPNRPTLPSPPSVAEDRALSDTTSNHSSHTLHSISGPVSHPELHDPGLNASIIETVNAWFSEGSVTRSFVVGELALAYNSVGETSLSKIVRLDNFPVLEKVAANPHFVSDVSMAENEVRRDSHDDEKGGQYTVSLPSISRSVPTVAFKYQVHLDQSSLSSYCPVLLSPAWNLEEFQASVIIAYSLNPSFISAVPLDSIILRNVVLTVHLNLSPGDEVAIQPHEVARATGAVMYPNTGASFRRKQSAVVWKLPEIEVKARVDGKFLARFSTAISWPRKGAVEAKFEYHTTDTASRLGISVASEAVKDEPESNPFADETTGGATPNTESMLRKWKEVPTVRKLAVGKYVAS